MYPRARLDALSDAVFGVAMTLLVLDVRLPEELHPHDANELLQALFGLMPKFWPYALSFVVLGLRWLSGIQVRSQAENLVREYVNWWLLYLLLITCVPFTTTVVGRFAGFAPAIWLYAGNTVLIAAVAFRLLALTPDLEQGDHLRDRQISLTILIVSSLLAVAWSFVSPPQALLAFVLNLAAPAIGRWQRKSS
jgi:TMEM175 potassium channel family protein